MIFFKNKGGREEIITDLHSGAPEARKIATVFYVTWSAAWCGPVGQENVKYQLKKTFFEIKWIQSCIIFNSYYNLCVFHLFFIQMQSNFFSNLLKIKIFSRFIKVEIPWKHVWSFLHVVDFTITGLVVSIRIYLLVWKKNL